MALGVLGLRMHRFRVQGSGYRILGLGYSRFFGINVLAGFGGT